MSTETSGSSSAASCLNVRIQICLNRNRVPSCLVTLRSEGLLPTLPHGQVSRKPSEKRETHALAEAVLVSRETVCLSSWEPRCVGLWPHAGPPPTTPQHTIPPHTWRLTLSPSPPVLCPVAPGNRERAGKPSKCSRPGRGRPQCQRDKGKYKMRGNWRFSNSRPFVRRRGAGGRAPKPRPFSRRGPGPPRSPRSAAHN